MSFDWTLYIDLAQALVRQADGFADKEACLRSAISRAYYGAFGLARETAVLRHQFQLQHTAQDHANLIRHFRQSSFKAIKQIGVNLDRLRRVRNRADYENQFRDLEKQSWLALQRAQQIKRDLS